MSNLYLVGFMGAGKSLVGRLLAERLDRSFVDLDVHIEETVGMAIPEIFEAQGEDAFRRYEREALAWTTRVSDAVVATGGGAACDAVNLNIMHASGGRSVFLDVPWSVLAARLGQDLGDRPMITTEKEAKRLFEARRPHYQEASWTVALTGRETPEQVVSLVLEVLAGVSCAT